MAPSFAKKLAPSPFETVPLATKVVPAPLTVSVAPVASRGPVICDAPPVSVREAPGAIAISSFDIRLLISKLWSITTFPLPARSITTSCVVVGTLPPVQFAVSLHDWPSPAPLHVTVDSRVRNSNDSDVARAVTLPAPSIAGRRARRLFCFPVSRCPEISAEL